MVTVTFCHLTSHVATISLLILCTSTILVLPLIVPHILLPNFRHVFCMVLLLIVRHVFVLCPGSCGSTLVGGIILSTDDSAGHMPDIGLCDSEDEN